MDSFTKQMIDKVMEDEHSAAKALAYFMFREIVEDIHAEGKITDEEMKELEKLEKIEKQEGKSKLGDN